MSDQRGRSGTLTLVLSLAFRLSPKYVLVTGDRDMRAWGGMIPCLQSEDSKGWLPACTALPVERGLPSLGRTGQRCIGDAFLCTARPSCCSGLRFWGPERAGEDRGREMKRASGARGGWDGLLSGTGNGKFPRAGCPCVSSAPLGEGSTQKPPGGHTTCSWALAVRVRQTSGLGVVSVSWGRSPRGCRGQHQNHRDSLAVRGARS